MFDGAAASWNLRDRHMADALDRLIAHLGRHRLATRIVVWAHNSHVGDARQTEMAARVSSTLANSLENAAGAKRSSSASPPTTGRSAPHPGGTRQSSENVSGQPARTATKPFSTRSERPHSGFRSGRQAAPASPSTRSGWNARLGSSTGRTPLRAARGPGLVLVIPLIERTRWVNLQVDTADIPPQDLITKDNVTIRVEAAVFFRVVDPIKAVVAIRDYHHAILRVAQTTLRATLGRHELDDVLANQAAINEQLKQIIDTATEPWGIQVVAVETKDVDLPDTMEGAMARQAEAERERRAKIIAAEGEFQAAERLSQAAGVISQEQAR
jgi:hypothetical protein